MTMKNNGRDLTAEKRRRLAAIQDDLRQDGTYNRCKDCMTGHPPDVSSHPDPLHYVRDIINL